MWRLPAANLEGSHASPERTLQTTPLATTVRPVRARRQHEPHPLEVDRPPRRHPGQGVRPRADRRRVDHPRPPARDPGGARRGIHDRGRDPRGGVDRRQGAEREPRGRDDRERRPDRVSSRPTAAVASTRRSCSCSRRWTPTPRRPSSRRSIASVGRLRRGMTAVVITASLDPSWVRPLAALAHPGRRVRRRHARRRGVRPGYERATRSARRCWTAPLDERRRRRDRRGDRQASSRPEPRARRIRAAGPHDHPEPPARRDPRRMTTRGDRGCCCRSAGDGWFTLALVTLICVTLAWSLDDARSSSAATS